MVSKCIYFHDRDVNELNSYLKKGWRCTHFVSTVLQGSVDYYCINYAIIEKEE